MKLGRPCPELTTYAGVCFTEFLRLIYLSRSDIQKRFSITDIFGRTVLLAWYHLYGRNELRLSSSDVPQAQWHLLNDRCEETGLCGDHFFSKMQAVLWLSSSLGKEPFDMGQLEDRWRIELLVSSCLDKPEGIEMVLPGKSALLFADTADPDFAADIPISVNRLFSAVWAARKDLQSTFPRGSRQSSAALVLWFLHHGKKELDLNGFKAKALDREYLLSASVDLSPESDHNISHVLHQIWCSSLELQDRYDLQSSCDRRDLLSWFQERGISDYGLEWLFKESTLSTPVLRVSNSPTVSVVSDTDLDVGLNIIGNAQGGFGMSQHAIRTALAARSAGIPYTIVDLDNKTSIEQCEAVKLGCIVTRMPAYRVNIAACTPNNVPHTFAAIGLPVLQRCHNIYYGNWEYQQYPSDHVAVIETFDEIWAPSQFTYNALRAASHRPLFYVPLAVVVPDPQSARKADFNIPDDSFLFLHTFDFHAGILRKNPIACVQAFIEAFPQADTRVCLLIKTKNVNSGISEDHQAWTELKQRAKRDARVIILDGDLTGDKMSTLVNLCDAFVSLHRAEGFGLAMAEAMFMGKPVIATNHSGNTEFTLPANSCPVDNLLVRPPEAVGRRLGVETTWADPDVAQAAWYMRRVFADHDYRRNIGTAARQYISENYSTAIVGQHIKRRLNDLEINHFGNVSTFGNVREVPRGVRLDIGQGKNR